jgi:alkanesulfonate monooxygenase SsuD/methylene tetrahydromethanopterin reductase-like flavin-dependent oxidoreductase (luciferase family)
MATPRAHFGVTLPQIKRSWQEARDTAIAIDRLGFDSGFVCDHLYGVPFPDLPIFEAWSELAAVAAITEKIELGTLVTPPFFRHTAVFAKQLATIDHISNGRTICGLGAGWFDAEFRGYGLDFPSTGKRLEALEEMCIVLKRMWTEPTVTFNGAHVRVDEAYCAPKPIRQPRILIGGGGEKVLLRIAAEHADIWNNMGVAQGEFARKYEVLRRHCEKLRRDPAEIVASQQCLVVIAETEAEATVSLAKAQKIYGGHLGGGLETHGIWGHPARVIDCIERSLALGCSMFVIEFFGRDTKVPATLFAEKVMPAFR